MIISNKQLQSILQLNQVSAARKKSGVPETGTAKKADSLVLSQRAQDLNNIKEMVLKSPEIRADKLGELKKQVQEGTYQISGNDIAHKMIGRSLVDEIARR